MKRALMMCSVVGAALLCSSVARADDNSFKVGGQVDISLPDGVAVGPQVRLPYLPWFKLGAEFTYTLAWGARGSLLIDPIKFPVAPVAEATVGYQSPFTIPGLDNSPSISYSYQDLNVGLGFGKRDGFRFLLLSGMSHINGQAANFQQLVNAHTTTVNGLTIGSPRFDVWVPDFRLGGEWLF
jgi:hypothetical protein